MLNFYIFCFTRFSISWNTAAWMHRILWCINPNARLIWDASNKIWLWCICIMYIILCLIVPLHHRRWCTCWWGWRCCRSWRASDNKATIARWCASGASANAALVHPGPAIFSALPSQLMSTPCHMLLSSAEIFLWTSENVIVKNWYILRLYTNKPESQWSIPWTFNISNLLLVK